MMPGKRRFEWLVYLGLHPLFFLLVARIKLHGEEEAQERFRGLG